ncbi:hypothetical protein BKA93DRAFT_754511 [Sparassis latifolia]
MWEFVKLSSQSRSRDNKERQTTAMPQIGCHTILQPDAYGLRYRMTFCRKVEVFRVSKRTLHSVTTRRPGGSKYRAVLEDGARHIQITIRKASSAHHPELDHECRRSEQGCEPMRRGSTAQKLTGGIERHRGAIRHTARDLKMRPSGLSANPGMGREAYSNQS